ncbi:MAG: tetratricopeptide repeat protein [Rikenellaceae bacterium]
MKIPTILAALFSLCLFGCRGDVAILDQAESLVDLHADSAYHLLSTISIDDIRGRANRARYALLYTKSLDKQKMRLESDSLTSIALDYYQNHGSDYHRASAYFYAARVNSNCDEIPEAVQKLTYAQELVPPDSLYLKGLIASLMGMCYADQLDHTNAIRCNEEAYDIFSKLEIKANQASSLYNQAKQYAILKNYQRAIKLQQESRQIYYELKDTANIMLCELSITRYRSFNGESISAVRNEFFREREKYKNYPQTKYEYDLLSQLYGRDHMADSARYYLGLVLQLTDTTTNRGKVTYHLDSSKMSASAGKYRAAYWQLREAVTHIDREYSDNLKYSASKLTEKYRGEIYKERSLRLEQKQDNMLIIGGTLLALTICVVYMLVRYYRGRLRRLDEGLGIAQDLAQSVANSMSIIESVSDRGALGCESLDNLNFMMIKLNRLIEKIPKYESNPQGFINEFVTLIRREKIAQSDSRTIFSQIIDREYNGVLSTLESRYNLDSNEIEILSMVALGVSNSAMRIILDHTNNRTIYNLRSSIKSKLNISIDSHSILELLSRECDDDAG